MKVTQRNSYSDCVEFEDPEFGKKLASTFSLNVVHNNAIIWEFKEKLVTFMLKIYDLIFREDLEPTYQVCRERYAALDILAKKLKGTTIEGLFAFFNSLHLILADQTESIILGTRR